MPACLAFVCLLTQVFQEPYTVVDSSSRGTVVSADEKTVATLNYSGNIVIWRATRSNKPLSVVRVIRPSGEEFGLLSVSPHGERLATVNANGHIRIYELKDFHMSVDYSLGTGEQNAWYRPDSLSWQPKKNRFVVSIGNGTSMMENPLHKFMSIPVDAPLSWSPNGLRVAGLVRAGAAIYDFTKKKIAKEFKEALDTYEPVALSPDGKYLITGGEDPKWNGPDTGPDDLPPTEAAYAHQLKLKVWRVVDGKRIHLLPGFESNSGGEVNFVSSRQISIPSHGDIYDLITGRRVKHVRFASIPDGGRIALSPVRKHPFRWRYLELPSQISVAPALDFSTDSRYLAMAGSGGEAFVWDLQRGVMKARLPGRNPAECRQVRFLPSRELALNTGGALVLYSLNFQDPHIMKGPKLVYDRDADLPKDLPKMHFETFQLLPDGKTAMKGEFNATKWPLWDIKTGQTLSFVRGDVEPMLFSGDASKVVFSAFSKGPKLQVAMRDLSSGKTLWINTDYEMSRAVAFSPDEKLLAIQGLRKPSPRELQFFLALLDPQTGKTIKELEVHEASNALCFSPDGKSVYRATGTGVYQYRVHDLRQVSFLPVLGSTRRAIATSPDGKLIAVATGSQSIRVIDSRSLQVLITIVPFEKSGWVAYTISGAANGDREGLGRLLMSRGDTISPLSTPTRPEELTIRN